VPIKMDWSAAIGDDFDTQQFSDNPPPALSRAETAELRRLDRKILLTGKATRAEVMRAFALRRKRDFMEGV
jgi:hypothetical protein